MEPTLISCIGTDMSGMPVKRLTGTDPYVPRLAASGDGTLQTGEVWASIDMETMMNVAAQAINCLILLFIFVLVYGCTALPDVRHAVDSEQRGGRVEDC